MSVHNSRTESRRNTKIGWKVPHDKRNIAHQFQGQRSKVRVTDGVILTHKMPHIFRMVRRTKFKLGTQVDDDDQRHAQAPCPPRSNPKVTRARDQSDACRSITRKRKAVETAKLVGRFPTTSAILRTSFNVKRSKIRVTDGVILTHKMPDIFRTVRPTKFKLRV